MMPSRRDFLGTAAVAAVTPGLEQTSDRSGPPTPAHHIVRVDQPTNLETPYELLLDSLTTDRDAFYVRNHFAQPKVDGDSWHLAVDGAVERPLRLSLAEIEKMETENRHITMECAGNSRVFLTPKVRGVSWGHGAVGNAMWTGATLASVLGRAGVKKSAVEVVLEGADVGSVNEEPVSPGPIPYARSLPLVKALRPEVLLAHKMNGEPLSPAHGWPLRAIVGGWYGMASIKWLTKIIVVEQPFHGYWQTMDYSQFERVAGGPTMAPITAMRIKAVILTPQAGRVYGTGPMRIAGRAWAGESTVKKVEVSTDGGGHWKAVELGDGKPFEWVPWTFAWTPGKPGTYKLMARATDAAGNTQPMTRDPDRRTYQINHVIPVEVAVK